MKRHILIHPFNAAVIIHTTVNGYRREIKKSFKTEPPEIDSSTSGVCSRNDIGDSIIGVFNYRYSTLMHEIAHCVFTVLDTRGVPISKDNDETFCYLQDNIFKRFFEDIKKEELKKWNP